QAAIRINGRDLKMSAEDMTSYLNALPADRVKSIEVVVQPGSDEASDGANTIVNIILNNPAEGLLGSIALAGKRDSHTYSGETSLWLGYNKGGFSMSGSIVPSYRNGKRKQRAAYTYTSPIEKSVEETTGHHFNNFSISGTLSGEYAISKQSNAGITLRIGGGNYKNNGLSTSIQRIGDSGEVNKVLMSYHENSPMKLSRVGAIAYYTLKTDSKGSKLDVTADYAVKRYMDDYLYGLGTEDISQHISYNWQGLSFKPSYRWMINDSHMVKAGYDYYFGKTLSRDSYNVIANDFRYQENIHSVYAQWMAQWSEAFSMSAGLRMEDAHTRGSSETGAAGFERHDTYLIPTLSLDVKLPWYHNSVSINFSRSVRRPFYQKLNPEMVLTSPTTYTIGNPYLKNSISWSGSIYYTLLKSLTCYASVLYSPDAAFDYTYDRDGMTVTGCEDMGSSMWFYPGLSYTRSFGNLYLKSSLEVIYMRYKAQLDGVDLSECSWNWEFAVSADYTISKKHNISMDGYYMLAPGASFPGRYINSKHIVRIGASKRWNSGWRLSLDIFNVLNSKSRQYFNSPSYSYSIVNPYDEVNVSLSVRYNFGKQTVKAVQGRQYNELDLH
ncbi:MAG: TonB-dependent receptor, partial [Muribaculaceae bacterium]|nr:TonB-dependent receptor [Muribaculaceae bacterium]